MDEDCAKGVHNFVLVYRYVVQQKSPEVILCRRPPAAMEPEPYSQVLALECIQCGFIKTDLNGGDDETKNV